MRYTLTKYADMLGYRDIVGHREPALCSVQHFVSLPQSNPHGLRSSRVVDLAADLVGEKNLPIYDAEEKEASDDFWREDFDDG